MVLFAAAHTIGFRQNQPEWKAEAVIESMRSVHFNAEGFTRTYWDFFSAFGLYLSVFLLFSAVVAWLLSGLAPEILASVRGMQWTFAICYVAITVLSWRYAFTAPLVLSALIAVCSIAPAWLTPKTS
jgi:hypothetical protein